MARLVVLSEGFTGRSYELKVEKTTVGRLEDNAFQIPEASVSSHHCEILLRGSEFLVRDLNSTNGSFINGEKVAEAPLKPGQILRLGQVEMRLESGATDQAGKKSVTQTMVVPQGVKLGEGTRPVNFETDSPFARKTNKANRVFIGLAVVVGLVVIALLIYAWLQLGRGGQ
jgi:pSer/pThr/pTyr-binding forkhead associated (FHA) protein